MKKPFKNKIVYLYIGIIVSIIALVMTFVWYDWKLFLILFMWEWGHNMERSL